MTKAALQVVGWVLARLPEPAVAALTWLVARGFYSLVASRRRLMLSNLHHAFPDRAAAWHRQTARECIRRFVETAFLSLAMPWLPDDRIRRIARLGAGLQDCFAAHRANPFPAVIGAPHFAHWEVQTAQPLLAGPPFPEYAAIYRPIDNAAADAWIKRTRERFGVKLLSRREGFVESVRVLRRQGMVGILFDQNAGDRGSLTLLLDRVCSTTELPGLLAQKCAARVFGLFPRYLGFWRVQLEQEEISHDGSAEGITIAYNRWIETLVRSDDNICASWLWGHQRWKNQDEPASRLRLALKRNLLAAELRTRQLAALPRRTRLWIRLPNWLGDVVMALPLLRALRTSRPDAEITLLARPQFLPLLERAGVADRLRPLPARSAGYFLHFWRLRGEYPDCYLLFTHSLRGDLEAWLTGCRQRFGLERNGRRRPLLTHRFQPDAGVAENSRHQFNLWTDFLRHFGLDAPADLAPFPPSRAPAGASRPIGLIAGSENNPEKRWPVAHWRKLIASLPDHDFILFGTANDRAITGAIATGFEDRTTDLAGRTGLAEFADRLTGCQLLVTNDTGGMHLANALGVPLVALFGPTNPVRTGPIFQSPAVILQPAGCPPTGGAALELLEPAAVKAAVCNLLAPGDQ